MEITLKDYSGGQDLQKTYPITDYKVIVEKIGLYLAFVTEYGDDDNLKLPAFEIRKVQFIASCQTPIKDDLVVAFYLGEDGTLKTQIIDDCDLPRGLVPNGNAVLVDYNAYCDSCNLTGETTLSFGEYLYAVKNGRLLNYVVNHEGSYLNVTQDDERYNQKVKLRAEQI